MDSIAKDYRVNQQIRAPQVRVIGENGEQLGVFPLQRALEIARERGLDLVEVAPTAVPPVCRLLDYDRWRYLQTKREKESRKSHRVVELREIRFRPRIAEHDRQSKVRRARELLQEGNKVKLTVMFRGREITHPELGLSLLRSIAEDLKGDGKLEAPPSLEGRFLSIIMAPARRPAAQAQQEKARGKAEAEEIQT